ncbi:hypothetical protein PPTG_11644 [Phytophthora nicotianae INRA-310]|uniref:Uncharacterized protein n=1 Tax=Phytophthora nicotianae (strain INRA-310) TaxID=761204 RepID=W2Q6R1_PHYN3|nr:hypothetical protein PPTG_11644 [Phytophthora nicotianae INRA-310]ETN08827.1 hypothetical protein PPTG_11644 [Phytophthora nicotianae INRA-310]
MDGEGALGSKPLSPRARRMAGSVLDTPRGREMFSQFLARLARQPAPSEEPTPARTTARETAEAVMSTPRARPGDAFPFDASRQSLPLVSETRGETTRHPSPGVEERHSVAGMPFPERGTPRRQGMTPVQAVEMPTRRAGTPTTDSALQEMLVDTFSRALQRLSVSAETPTRTPRSEGARPLSRPEPAATGNALGSQTRLVSTPMVGYQGPIASRVALPPPASTPVGMPMAAIPSYGSVIIQVPSRAGMMEETARRA